MDSLLCKRLDEPYRLDITLRTALRVQARGQAQTLGAHSRIGGQVNGPRRLAIRHLLIQTLEACKRYGDEPFWRDVLAEARQTMQREVKS